MKTCTILILLTILCPGGCPVYDFDLKTIEQPSEFSDTLKLQADLNSEMEQGLLQINLMKDPHYGDDHRLDSSLTSEETAVANLKGTDSKSMRACPEEPPETPEIVDFVGTNLFDGNRRKCFSTEDVALLTARKDFEMLIPKDLPQSLLTDEMVGVLMEYFYGGNQVIQRMSDACSKRLTEKAFYDTMGGYLKYYMLPVTKFSFYAGQVDLKTVENVVALYQQCKTYLNTNGNGWRAPIENVLTELKSVQIEPLKINESDGADGGEGTSCCTRLDLTSVNNDAEDEQMIVSLPKLETEDSDGYLGNIWLPFKRKRTFNLRSSKSAFIVVKFYETVTRCYQFQAMCQDSYNHKFKAWILENIQVHLADEQFYPGLGAVLRIYENLKRGKKSAFINDGFGNDYEGDQNSDSQAQQEKFNEKRQKTEAFVKIENKSKQMKAKNKNSYNWFEKMYGKHSKRGKNHDQERLEDDDSEFSEDDEADDDKEKLTCPGNPDTEKEKNAPKSKCQQKNIEKEDSDKEERPAFYDFFTQQMLIKYLCYIVVGVLLLLLLILLCALAKKSKRRECKNAHCIDLPPPGPPKPPKQRRNICERLRKLRKTPKADEEILVQPDSASVLTPIGRRGSSSTSSTLACQPPKCIPICSKATKAMRDSDAAVIETTSMEYSSSEPEETVKKKSKKGKSKVVTIDEKKNQPLEAPPKKRFGMKSKKDNDKPETSKENGKAPRIGLQRNSKGDADAKSNNKQKEPKVSQKDRQQSTSWETMYET